MRQVLRTYRYECMGIALTYLSSFVTWEIWIAFLVWMPQKQQASLYVLERGKSGLMPMSMVNQNFLSGVVAIQSVI